MTLKITSTGTRYLYASIRAVNPVTNEDVDLSGAEWKMALMPPNDRPETADWKVAAYVGSGLVAGKTYSHARTLVGNGGNIVPLPGRYKGWVQVALGLEVVEEDIGEVIVL